MKQYHHKLWIGCVALLFSASLSAQPSALKGKLKTYFLQKLEQKTNQNSEQKSNLKSEQKGQPALNISSLVKSIKWKDAEKYQTLVWEAWKEANAQMNEEKLIPLRTLCAKNKGLWHLPASLEPSATMPYYWGIKWKPLTTAQIQQNYRTGFQGDDSESTDEHIAAAKPFPMYLYLHGSGPKEEEWKFGLMWAQYFNDAPSVYFIPQIPNEGEYYRWWQKAKLYAWEKMLRQSLAAGNVDANRLYVLGISEGGYGSQRLASYYADYWAGAGPMAGGEPLKNAPVENCANLAFSFLTGALDEGFYRNKLTGYTQAAFDSLQEKAAVQGMNEGSDKLFRHRIELIPGCGHSIDYSLTSPWLKDFKRNPYPKTFMWEDFPMDGQCRQGFYNLCVVERPKAADGKVDASGEDRDYYEMTIRDNVIRMSVRKVTYQTVERDSEFGIDLKFAKSYHAAKGGRWKIYLNDQLVDMNKPVTLFVNGKKVFHGNITPRVEDMVNSCFTYFDPYRVFPASVEVSL